MSFLLFHLHMKKDKKIRCEYDKLTYDSDTPPKGGGASLSTLAANAYRPLQTLLVYFLILALH